MTQKPRKRISCKQTKSDIQNPIKNWKTFKYFALTALLSVIADRIVPPFWHGDDLSTLCQTNQTSRSSCDYSQRISHNDLPIVSQDPWVSADPTVNIHIFIQPGDKIIIQTSPEKAAPIRVIRHDSLPIHPDFMRNNLFYQRSN